jgi:hypothetical protein
VALSDAVLAKTVNQHSEQFFPPFARLQIPPRGTHAPQRYAPLGLSFSRPEDPPFTVLQPDESLVWRLGCFVTAIGVMNSNGEPPAVTGGGSNFAAVKLFDGVGEVAITDRRVVLLGQRGESVAGAINIARGHTFALVFPFSSVESVTLSRRKGVFGTKITQVRVESVSRVGVFAISEVILEHGDGRWQRSRLGLPQVMDALVKAAATARLAASDIQPAERRLCEAALNGARVDDGDDSVAQLVP